MLRSWLFSWPPSAGGWGNLTGSCRPKSRAPQCSAPTPRLMCRPLPPRTRRPPHPSSNISHDMGNISNVAKAARVKRLIAGLAKTYPNAHCELNYSNPLELLVATILSAQCTDKRVNLVTAELFKKYHSAADYACANVGELERQIRTTGFFRNKSKSIKTCCQAIVEKHGGQVPRSMEELTELGGVGRKTANVVLGNAFNLHPGIVVEPHVARLAR